MDIGNPSLMKIKEFSREDLHSLMAQVREIADKARAGDLNAIDTLEGVAAFFIRRELMLHAKKKIDGRKARRKQAEKAGKPSPDETAIMQQAVDELVDSELDWEDMVAVMREEIELRPSQYNIGDKRTLLKILESNRTTIAIIAQSLYSPTP